MGMGVGMDGCVNVDLDWLRFLDESDAYYRAVFELVVVWVVVQLLLVALDMRVIVADFDDGDCRVAGVRGGRRGARVGAGVGGPAAVAEGGVLEAFGTFVAGVDALCLVGVSASHGEKGWKRGSIPLMICKNVKTVRDIKSSGTSWPNVDGSFSGLRWLLRWILYPGWSALGRMAFRG